MYCCVSVVGKSEFKPGSGRQKTRQEEEIEYLREQLQVQYEPRQVNLCLRAFRHDKF